MKIIFMYLWYVLRHKWYVFVECCKLGVPWLGVIHDLSKFSPVEFIAYARNFYGNYPTQAEAMRRCPGIRTKESVKVEFDLAWLHHQKSNKHHWQYWILQYDNSNKYVIQQHGEDQPMILATHEKRLIAAFVPPEIDDDIIFSEAYRRIRDIRDLLNLYPVCLPMPDKYRREMLADWIGAGMAITGKDNTKEWYIQHRDNIILHEETRSWVENKLGVK